MNTSKLPRRLGIAGIGIGLSLMGMWWYINTYDPFHLPTSEQVIANPLGYSTPPLYSFLKRLTLILCPAVWLQAFTIDLGPIFNYLIWILAALFDGLILYCAGLLINAVIKTHLPRLDSNSPVAPHQTVKRL